MDIPEHFAAFPYGSCTHTLSLCLFGVCLQLHFPTGSSFWAEPVHLSSLGGGVSLYLHEGGVSVQIIWNSLWEIYYSLFMYSVFIFITVGHGYVFYALGYNPSTVFFCYSNCLSLGHWELLQAGSFAPCLAPI